MSSAAKNELSALLEDLVELASNATGIDPEKLEDLKASLHERVGKFGSDARGAAKDAASSIQDQAEEALGKVDGFARAKPWQLALAAGLIGFVVGAMVSRK
ncbi:MAG: hypothetical protein WDO12_11235 [Pseudomonadota bacterium]